MHLIRSTPTIFAIRLRQPEMDGIRSQSRHFRLPIGTLFLHITYGTGRWAQLITPRHLRTVVELTACLMMDF